jgi:hypothetical protein
VLDGKLTPLSYINTSTTIWNPQTLREDDVRNDLKKTKLIKWAEQVQDRLRWKVIVAKAKTTRVVAQKKKKKQ